MSEYHKKMTVMKKKITISLLFISLLTMGYAQDVENEAQYRMGVELDFKIAKGLKLMVAPQLRFDNDFSVDRLQLETALRYKTFGFLYWEANYRRINKPQDDLSSEKFSKYGFSLSAKETYGRFTPALRLRYSNYADDDVDDKQFLRYKASVKYDIKKCKITPSLAIEAFQELNDYELYKMRYTAGADYKLMKNNYIGISYKLDYYKQEYRNRHIISLGYKYSF